MDLVSPWGEPVFDSMQGYALAAQAGENELGPTKMRMMNIRRNALQKAYLDRWNASATDGKDRIDGIIQAVSPWAAPRLGGTQAKSLYVGYTGVWNFLGTKTLSRHAGKDSSKANAPIDFPACTFPVTLADKNLDRPIESKTFTQLSDIDGRIQKDYDAEFYHGAPVSLQVVGKRLEEEKVLEMTEAIANALKVSS
jgi:amidase